MFAFYPSRITRCQELLLIRSPIYRISLAPARQPAAGRLHDWLRRGGLSREHRIDALEEAKTADQRMELARDKWGLNDQLARSAAAAEEARRSKAWSLRSESEAEGPEPSEKMVDELAEDGEDELEEGELDETALPPTLQEDPVLDEREFPIPSPRPITDSALLLLFLSICSGPSDSHGTS